MSHLYVIAGHGDGDSGAVGCGFEEAERVRALATRIKELGGESVTLHDFGDNAYASKALSTLGVPDGCQIVELHMDSASADARGAHVIVGPVEFDAQSVALASAVSSMFPGRASSIVSRSDLQNPNIAARRGLAYRLVENGFITNAGDVGTFNSRMDDLARAYLSALDVQAVPVDEDVAWMQTLLGSTMTRLGRGGEAPSRSGVFDGTTRHMLIALLQTWVISVGDPTMMCDGEWSEQLSRCMRPYSRDGGGMVVSKGTKGIGAWAIKAGLVGQGKGGIDLEKFEFTASDAMILKAWQSDNGLEADGIAGEDTAWKLMHS